MFSASLEGRVAVLVGAGPGLGAAIARQLSELGASVILLARTEAVLQAIAADVRQTGGVVETQVFDLRSADDQNTLSTRIERQYGRLDILVHNAVRHGEISTFPEADLDDWKATMETNLWAPLALTQSLLPLLLKSRHASIVMVSAMAARMVSSRGRAGYAISKAALNQAVRSLAFELGDQNIRVNAVLPGWMEGPIIEEYRADPQRQGMVEQALRQIPLGRIPLPAEVAGSVAYLAGDLSKCVTGECVDANGGQYMRG